MGAHQRALAIAAALFAILALAADPVWANGSWSPVYILFGLVPASVVIVPSLVFETWAIYWRLVENIWRALYITLICNAVSFILGTFLFLGILPLYVDLPNVPPHWQILMLVGMGFFGSLTIELLFARVAFRYPFKQLLLPMSVANAMSYAVLALFLVWRALAR